MHPGKGWLRVNALMVCKSSSVGKFTPTAREGAGNVTGFECSRHE